MELLGEYKSHRRLDLIANNYSNTIKNFEEDKIFIHWRLKEKYFNKSNV